MFYLIQMLSLFFFIFNQVRVLFFLFVFFWRWEFKLMVNKSWSTNEKKNSKSNSLRNVILSPFYEFDWCNIYGLGDQRSFRIAKVYPVVELFFLCQGFISFSDVCEFLCCVVLFCFWEVSDFVWMIF